MTATGGSPSRGGGYVPLVRPDARRDEDGTPAGLHALATEEAGRLVCALEAHGGPVCK